MDTGTNTKQHVDENGSGNRRRKRKRRRRRGRGNKRHSIQKEVHVPFTLPGFTEPLNFMSHAERRISKYFDKGHQWKVVITPPAGSGRDLFPCALYEPDTVDRARLELTTLREFAMMRFMNEITDKPNWNVKIMDDTIAAKWKAEAQQQDDFSERMATYCVEELRWRAEAFEKTGFVFAFNGDVVKSDSAISDDLKTRLQAAVAKLEAIECMEKDYHPHSDNKVWDLVHPSLFPLVYGTSRILRDERIGLDDCLERIGNGEVVPVPTDSLSIEYKNPNYSLNSVATEIYSRKFQWLPCDVRMSVAGRASGATVDSSCGITCSITSYINNLHPRQHSELYAVIEEVLAAAIPLWNETLFANEGKSRKQTLRIPYNNVEYECDPETLIDSSVVDDGGDEFYEALCAARLSCIVYPEPEPFQAPPETMSEGLSMFHGTKTLPLVERYTASGLQVIVKLATIELTPETPAYDGGSWHVEGQLNEHICATALYYYSTENITESRLGFRQMSEAGPLWSIPENRVNYDQNDISFLEPIFGCRDDEPGLQDIGSVLCKEGRLLTFPNTLMHRVLPFELDDKSKSGHRKILALFLVDPNMHVISTSSVPPQRMDWWRNESRIDSWHGGLTQELKEGIESMMDFPLQMNQAKSFRIELMEERKSFEIKHSRQIESVIFSLCEH